MNFFKKKVFKIKYSSIDENLLKTVKHSDSLLEKKTLFHVQIVERLLRCFLSNAVLFSVNEGKICWIYARLIHINSSSLLKLKSCSQFYNSPLYLKKTHILKWFQHFEKLLTFSTLCLLEWKEKIEFYKIKV